MVNDAEEKDMKVDDKPDDMEWVSAIADGELAEHEFSELAATLGTSDEARAAWHAYHVIGDVCAAPTCPIARATGCLSIACVHAWLHRRSICP